MPSSSNAKYEGDLFDPSATPLKEKFQKLELDDPSDLLYLADEYLRAGEYTLHKWQINLHEHLASARPTSHSPHKFCLVAANGSGKDAIIAAPFAVWFILSKIQSRVIITSSSGTQLTSQTEPAIRRLCQRINEMFGEEYFRIRQRYIYCRLSGSEIRMFATDEAGKAEGYHPIVPGGEMAILINEAKSVSDEIYSALKRCSGYNYWIEYSSPGEPTGHFYKMYKDDLSIEMPIDNIEKYVGKRGKFSVRITSYDCISNTHLSLQEIEDDKRELGEHSALFRSKHLALFTSIGGEVIISSELLDKVLQFPPSFSILNWPIRIGIDLAAGGDENVICFSKENKVLKEYAFRETDTTITADRIEQILKDENIDKDHKYIFADDGGIGHAIIDTLCRRGWKINRIMNQWAAFNKKQFGNRGAENWYRIKRLFEEGLIDLSTISEKTRNQLITRRYKQVLTGARIYLESKKEARANGRPSPDRADALILSFTGLTIDDFISAKTDADKPANFTKGETLLKTNEEVIKYYEDNVTYAHFTFKKRTNGKRLHGSLLLALNNQNNVYE